MKLNGLGLILPIFDWRPLITPSPRLQTISPLYTQVGKTYIKGFGVSNFRKTPRIPWRPSDLIYFNSNQAIELPTHLPEGSPVVRTIRRLYLDDYSQVRLELQLFTDIYKKYKDIKASEIEDCIEGFWKNEVILKKEMKKERLGKAIYELADHFVLMTSIEDVNPLHYEYLLPQIIVTLEAKPHELPSTAIPLDQKAKLWIDYKEINIAENGGNSPIDTFFLINLPNYFQKPIGPELETLRIIKAHIISFYSDFQFLTYLAATDPKDYISDVNQEPIFNYILQLCRETRAAFFHNQIDNIIISKLFDLFEKKHGNKISRILGDLEKEENFPLLIKNKLNEVFSINCSEKKISSSIESRASFESGVINEKIKQALGRYMEYLSEGDENIQKYDDEKFKESAIRKASVVIQNIPENIRKLKEKIVFISVGGGDGEELFSLMEKTGSKFGILIEKNPKSIERASKIIQDEKLSVEILPGDIIDNLPIAIRKGKSRIENGEARLIIVTIHAVLHELPTRSSRGFELSDIFSKINDSAVIIGREPIEPNNWEEIIELSGDFDSGHFLRFLNFVKLHHIKRELLERPEYLSKEISKKTISGHRALIMEAISKIFYSEDFPYEIQECVTSFTKNEIIESLYKCLDEKYYITTNDLISKSNSEYWYKYGFKAKGKLSHKEQGHPISHFWYIAIHPDWVSFE